MSLSPSHVDRKVFSKLNFHVSEETVKKVVRNTEGVIEPILCTLRERVKKKLEHTTNTTTGYTVCMRYIL